MIPTSAFLSSRGLDIAGVSHGINYDVPEHPEDYVHRIGHTDRAHNVGDAFTLMNGKELPALQAIEHFIGQKIPRLKLENFPYLYTALFEPETPAGKRAIGRWSPLSRIFVRMTPALADSGHGFSGLGARLATNWSNCGSPRSGSQYGCKRNSP